MTDDTLTSTESEDVEVLARGLRVQTRRRRGKAGPPLLLIHGLGGSMDSWRAVLDRMPDRDVIMIDTPGMGRSELPSRPLSVGGIADVFAEAIAQLGVTELDILGYSHGGTVVQEFVHRHPGLVRRVVLVCTVAGQPWIPPGFRAQRALMSTKRYRSRAAAKRDLPVLAGGRTARDPEVLAEMLADREANVPSKTGYRYLQIAALPWSSHLWLHSIKHEVLVIAGGDDPVVRPINGRILAARLPNARLEVLDDAGHMLLFDESDRSVAVIDGFLSADRPSAP